MLSARPNLDVGLTFPWGDKVGHLVLFGILGATLAYGRVHAHAAPSHVALILAGSLYGLGDEWHQSFVPGRDASAGDLLADVAGVALGYGFVVWWFGPLRPSRAHEGGPSNDVGGSGRAPSGGSG